MLIALAATVAAMQPSGLPLAAVLIPGALIGAAVASRVQMTSMPQLVAILHSFVGLAAVLVGFGTYLAAFATGGPSEGAGMLLVEIFIGVCIGAVTFTGSVIAFLKLQGTISGRPLMLPGRHMINLAMLAATIVLGVLFVMARVPGHPYLLAATIITFILGTFRDGDRRSGYAGRRLDAQQLFRLGGRGGGLYAVERSADHHRCLVGSSGAILSYIMCRGMNRSFFNVMLGGFGTESGTVAASADSLPGEVRSLDAETPH
jgi:H+-translocating NAD(P) transhydrogenase subunit beta